MIACADVQQTERLIAKRPLEVGKFRTAPADEIADRTQAFFFRGGKILKKQSRLCTGTVYMAKVLKLKGYYLRFITRSVITLLS